MKAPEIVGWNIRLYREKLGLSQEALADISGLHRTYIGQVELGKRNLSIINVFKIAEALQVRPHLLLVVESTKLRRA